MGKITRAIHELTLEMREIRFLLIKIVSTQKVGSVVGLDVFTEGPKIVKVDDIQKAVKQLGGTHNFTEAYINKKIKHTVKINDKDYTYIELAKKLGTTYATVFCHFRDGKKLNDLLALSLQKKWKK